MKQVFFEEVEIGQRFCFSNLNEERPDNWFLKTGDGGFVDDSDQVRDLEEEGMSRYSERVFVRDKADSHPRP